MPGHVKRGGTGEPDPDPSPFLFVSWEDKQNDMAKVKSQNLYEYTICVSYTNLSLYPYWSSFVPYWHYYIDKSLKAKLIAVIKFRLFCLLPKDSVLLYLNVEFYNICKVLYTWLIAVSPQLNGAIKMSFERNSCYQ